MLALCENFEGAVPRIALTIVIAGITTFLFKLYRARMTFYRMKRLGIPTPPWNPIFGNLAPIARSLSHLPKDVQQSSCFVNMSRGFAESDNLFYVDAWPFSYPMIIVTTPDIAHQVCHEYDLPKPDSLLPFFRPITGGLGVFMMNGEEHRKSRALFAPGFSQTSVYEQAGNIVEEAKVYVEILREHAKKQDMVLLDDVTCLYMIDVIGTVIFNARLNCQRTDNVLASAMRDQIKRHVRAGSMDPIRRFSLVRPFMQWYNGHRMDRYITAELHKRFQELSVTGKPNGRTNSVIDMAMDAYLRDQNSHNGPSKTLDKSFISWACAQIRLFLYVGHDSTAATIVYSLHMLSKHPEILKRVRTEHDEVFGKNPSKVAEVIKARPSLMNQLPLTTAVIKETLRLFPPAGSFRGGLPGVHLRGKNGQKYPTEGMGVLLLHDAIHKNPDYWPEPLSFLPERWMVGPEHPLYPVKSAWRPFEFGSHNCIGQSLVMLDIGVTLAMVIREFDVKDAYVEWDLLHPSGGIKTVDGERAYQISAGSAHPANGYPCRVSLRDQAQ